MELKFNDKQTSVPKEVLDALPQDTIERFLELIESVPFVKWMVSPDRPRAKDLPRDDKGRIIVDITKPHILEDMDYFREMAIAYENSSDDDELKTYTKLRPNGNPNSEYMKLWKREIDRIWNGMVRPSDGEWIPGILYFYWNYSRIMFVNIVDGTEKGDRVESFPEPWDSTYIWAHYIYQAQYGGKYNGFKGGEHFGVIARRGIGKSFFIGSITTRTFMCGENSRVKNKAKVFLFAYDKQYIDTGKDGTLGKFVDMFEFLAKKTQFPHLLLQQQEASMHWTIGYETRDGRKHGLLNEVTGVSVKDKPGKVRGKRGVYTFYEEFGSFQGFLETFNTSRYNAEEGNISFGTIGAIGCVCAGTKVLDKNFNEVDIKDLKQEDGIIGFNFENHCFSIEPITYIQDECYKRCVEIVTKNRVLRCSIDHPISTLINRDGMLYYGWTKAGDFFKEKDISVSVPEMKQDTSQNVINFEKVISVRKIGIRRIYNLTANKTHTYLANGIITHNTGGAKGADFSGALEMIYHPSGYKMHSLPNVFDKSKGKLGESILFLGAYLNRKTCYDKNGNSDVIKAILQILERQHIIRISSTNPATLAQAKAEDPLTIEDAIMKTEKNIYPVADLNARIQELRMDPKAFDDIYVGKLNIVGGHVEFQKTTDTPIRDFPLGDNKAEGALEIYKMPEVSKTTNEPIAGRYLLGADVFDNDVADSLSLGSVFVLDAFTDRIVAEYTGRPQYAAEFYEICRRLCLFYNGKLCYENNYKGLYSYFSQYHSTYLLTPVFQYLRDEDRFKGETFGNTAYGVRATTPIRNYSRGLIREWLLKPRTKVTMVNGEEVEETYPQLMDIKNVALLKELAQYDTEHNFDRHDALAMLMLYREDVYRLNEGDPNKLTEKPVNKVLGGRFFTEYDRIKKRKSKTKNPRNVLNY